VAGQQLTVWLDGGERRVSFHSRDYDQLEHGYATTIHKAQGTTVEYSYLLLTRHLDRHGSYVALSRHRHGVAAFYARDEFADLAALTRRLGRDGSKVMALPAELPGADERGRLRCHLAGLRAALGRVGAMLPGVKRAPADPAPRSAAAEPGAGGESRLEQQLARAREIAAQLRQRQAMQRQAAAAQERDPTDANQPGGTRLEQQLARAKEAAAQLRQEQAARAAGADAGAAAQAKQPPSAARGISPTAVQPAEGKTAQLQQQLMIARRVAARLR
jgi:hypothetical protein